MQLPDFPGEARDDAAAFAIGERIYVGTGYQVGWVLASDWYVFDADTWQWDTIAPLPATPRQYCTTFVIDGIGYLFGGLDATGALDELWAYDPAADAWMQKASLPAEARYACASFAIGPLGYVCTGMLASGVATAETWSYDPSTDQWAQLADLPGVPRHRAAACAGGQWAHVIGGADTGFLGLADVWSFNQATGLWSSLFASLPQVRHGADATMMQGGTIFLMGGALDNTTFHNDGLLGSSSDLTWTPTSPFPPGTRRGGVLARTQGDPAAAYFGTGLDSALTRHNDWWMATNGNGVDENRPRGGGLVPNPGSDGFRLTAPVRVIDVRDGQGRSVFHTERGVSGTIDAGSWEPGLYLVTITDPSGRRSALRWIKL